MRNTVTKLVISIVLILIMTIVPTILFHQVSSAPLTLTQSGNGIVKIQSSNEPYPASVSEPITVPNSRHIQTQLQANEADSVASPSFNNSVPAVSITTPQSNTIGLRVSGTNLDEPVDFDWQTVPILPNPRDPNEAGWSEWFFVNDPAGSGCNHTHDRLYDSSVINPFERGFWEVHWGKAPATAVGQSEAAWVAGGGKDAGNPTGNYPTRELASLMACARSNLTGIEAIALSMSAYIDIPDPDDYAVLKVSVSNRLFTVHELTTLIQAVVGFV